MKRVHIIIEVEDDQLPETTNIWGAPVSNGGCLHLNCPECHGTGIKHTTGGPCIHMLSCPCRRCSPSMMTTGYWS